MATIDTIRRIIIQAEERGLDPVTSKLRAFEGVYEDLASGSAHLGQSFTTVENKISSVSSAFERSAARADPLRREYQILASDLTNYKKALDQALISQEEFNRLTQQRVAKSTEGQEDLRAQQAIAAEVMKRRDMMREANPPDAHVAEFRAQQAITAELVKQRNMMREANPPDAHVAEFRAQQAITAEIVRQREMMREANPSDAHVAAYRAQQAITAELTKQREMMREANPPDSHVQQYRAQQAITAELAKQREMMREANPQDAHIQAYRQRVEALKAQAVEFERVKNVANQLNAQFASVAHMEELVAEKGNDIKAALSFGQIKPEVATKALNQLNQQLADVRRNAGEDGAGGAFKFASYQAANFGYQINDVISGLAMGQSPFTILTQQGGQFYQILSGAGGGEGIVGGLRSAGNWLKGFMTVGKVAFGTVAAAATGVAYAMDQQAGAAREFQNTVAGVGKGAGVTVGQLQNLSTEAARTGEVSLSAAQDMVNGYTRAGVIGAANIGGLAKVTKDFAATTGTDMETAQKALQDAFRDPGKGIDALASAIGGVDARTREYVQTLASTGKIEQAQAAMRKVLENNTIDAAKAVSPLKKEWDEFWNIMSTGLSRIGQGALNLFKEGDIDRQIADLRRLIKTLEEVPKNAPSVDVGESGGLAMPAPAATSPREMNDLRVRLQDLEIVKKAEKDTADAAKEAAQVRAQSALAAGVVDSLNPELAAYKQMVNQLSVLKDALKNADFTLRPGDVKAAQADIEALTKAIAQMGPVTEVQARANDRLRESFAAQVAVMNAFGPAQQAVAVADQKRAELGPLIANTEAGKIQIQQAGLAVLAQSTAALNLRNQADQAQLALAPQLITAAAQQGMAGIQLNAVMQAKVQLARDGIAADSAGAEAALKNAAAQAKLATTLKDVAQAAELRASTSDQVDMLKLETQLLGADDITRKQRLQTFQGEIQARALERQGLQESADATRQGTAEVAANEAALARRKAAIDSQIQADKAWAQQMQETARILQSQGRDAASLPMHTAGGTTRASDWQQAGANGAGMNFQIGLDVIQKAIADASFGEGNYGVGVTGGAGVGFQGGLRAYAIPDWQKIGEANKQREQNRQAAEINALNKAISATSSALQKWQSTLGDAEGKISEAEQKISEAKAKVEKAEADRQAKIQKYLAAGPSPYEQNADIYYDPVKRMAFAEQIAGNTDELLQQQVKAAEAEQQAAKAAAQSAKDQIDRLQGQEQQLSDAADLMSAGVELSKQEVAGILQLIGVVKGELPESIAKSLERVLGATVKEANTTISQNKSLGTSSASSGTTLSLLGGLAGGMTSSNTGLPANMGGLSGSRTLSSSFIPGTTSALGGARAMGGPITGPGTGTSDDVLMWGSNGEFVVNAAATARNRKLLEAINSGKQAQKFATGGLVGRSDPEYFAPSSARDDATGSFVEIESLLSQSVDLSKQELSAIRDLAESVRKIGPDVARVFSSEMKNSRPAGDPRAAPGTTPATKSAAAGTGSASTPGASMPPTWGIDIQFKEGTTPQQMNEAYKKAYAEHGMTYPGLAGGGPIRGPGTGGSDDVLMWGSNGEYVVNAAATTRHRRLLDAINDNKPIRKYASGGPIESAYGQFMRRPSGATTPAAEAAAEDAAGTPKAGRGGNNIERMIVQMPRGTNPIVLANKATRAQMARGVRRIGRSV